MGRNKSAIHIELIWTTVNGGAAIHIDCHSEEGEMVVVLQATKFTISVASTKTT